MPETIETREFEAFFNIEKAEGGMGTDDAPATVSGPAASEQDDLDGELMERSGISKGLTHWTNDYGAHVDYNHLYAKTQRPIHIIGRGEVFQVDGRPWIKTTLRKGNPWAQECFDMVRDKMKMGYSVMGDGVRQGKRVISTIIKMVTIAPLPKGKDQFLMVGAPAGSLFAVAKALVNDLPLAGMDDAWTIVDSLIVPAAHAFLPPDVAKALMTGSDVVTPGTEGGAALRTQYLLGSDEAKSHPDDIEAKKKKKFLEAVVAKSQVSPATAERIHKALCVSTKQ